MLTYGQTNNEILQLVVISILKEQAYIHMVDMGRYEFMGYLVSENTRIAIIYWDWYYMERVYEIIV